MRRFLAAVAAIAALASAAVSLSDISKVRSAAATWEDAVFIVPDNEGYGIAECLQSGGECGRVVADVWCEAQGFAGALSYGRASTEDGTARVQAVSAGPRAEPPVTVTCRR